MKLKLKYIFTITSIFVVFAGTGTEPKRTGSGAGIEPKSLF